MCNTPISPDTDVWGRFAGAADDGALAARVGDGVGEVGTAAQVKDKASIREMMEQNVQFGHGERPLRHVPPPVWELADRWPIVKEKIESAVVQMKAKLQARSAWSGCF